MKLISIIMNCKNGSKFIKSSIKSILAQTFKNWELIIWDNNSIDESKIIIKSFDDKRIKYFFSEQNNSLSKNRNDAVMISKGNFIAFLDTDDLWLPDHLELLINKIQQNNYYLIFSQSLYLFDNKNKKLLSNKIRFLNKNLSKFENYAINRNIFFGSILFNADILKKLLPFPSNINHSIDDYIILTIISLYENKFSNHNKRTFIYRIHSNNLTNFQTELSASESLEVLNIIAKKQNIKINKLVYKERYYKIFLISLINMNLKYSISLLAKIGVYQLIYWH